MYEKPRLNRVGDAEDVILGFMPFGNDLDLNTVNGVQEFADDEAEIPQP
jgi:hypothetical protein